MASKRSRAAYEADRRPRFAHFGTPLPQEDSQVRDDGSFVPVWKQEVRDERGRKRLHGAFTGGFSAGYFNTVGSKEGWIPSTFVSSRANKRKGDQNQQRPEDFMDDEDLADVAATKELEATGDFSGLGFTRSDKSNDALIMDLFEPSTDTGGTRLMRKMGWREGQGIGPKVKRTARLGDDDDGEDIQMDDAEAHWFAPANSPMVYLTPKHDRKGQGYVGEAKLNESSKTERSDDEEQNGAFHAFSRPRKTKTMAQKPSRNGFGVGILNNDSDDDDVYGGSPRISYNRVIGGNARASKAHVQKSNPKINPSIDGTTPVFLSKKGVLGKSAARKCHDGKLPVDGSVLAESLEPLSISVDLDMYPRPEVPEGWKSSKDATAPQADISTYQTSAEAAQASKLDSKSRGEMLGETPLPGKSVFDFLSPAARERIVAVTGRTDLPPARGETIPNAIEDEDGQNHSFLAQRDYIPDLDKILAISALGRGVGGWMPYNDDEAKRHRYRKFLAFRAELASDPPKRPNEMSKDNWIKELDEFKHAAEVFKPMTGMMASRFTTSSVAPTAVEEHSNDVPLLSTPLASGQSKDPAEEAARMDMFGPLTRSVHQFFPTRLVCKRFNVKPPDHAQAEFNANASTSTSEQAGSSQAQKTDLLSKATMEQMMQEASIAVPDTMSPSDAARKDATPSGQGRDSPMENDERTSAIHVKEAGDAVFNAIFENDSDSE